MRKRLWAIGVVCCLGLLYPGTVRAEHPRIVLFINQVRGQECCDAGSSQHLRLQLEQLQTHDFPGTFAIRYDALTDADFSRPLQAAASRHEMAALLEVTPSLARAAEVVYTGNETHWYRAKHVFLIGYTAGERRRLIDAYMLRFKAVFGVYPTTSVAWMIDADSLAYLRERYGVTTHELTREQWGTDSYTLYGGPEHYPYVASRQWPLIPDPTNADGVLIVRQTVDDPLYAYGDTTSAFTTQPNDYVRDKKDFGYFRDLLAEILDQNLNAYSVAVLGLENSMEQQHQDAYAAQIAWVAEYAKTNPAQILTARAFTALHPQLSQAVTVVSGEDIITHDTSIRSWWINAPAYRVRVLQRGQLLGITDLRIYDSTIPDPYMATASATANGYWVAPFVIDASRAPKGAIGTTRPRWSLTALWHTLFPSPSTQRLGKISLVEPSTDTEGLPQGWALPTLTTGSVQVERGSEGITLGYTGRDGAVTIKFDADGFSIRPVVPAPESVFGDLWGAQRREEPGVAFFTPFVADGLDWQRVRADYALFLDPESTARVATTKTSTVRAYNGHAIAGRNPVRLLVTARDAHNFATTAGVIFVQSEAGEELVVSQPQATQLNGPVYIDVARARVLRDTLRVTMDGILLGRVPVVFAPDCAHDLKFCATHPRFAWDYMVTKVWDRMRRQ